MTQNKEYYAFISYKREDEKWAKWLQDKLEHYRFPTNLNGRTDLPKNIRPTFRDVTDLKPGLLAEEINNALRNSEWLIVICSPRSAKSPWVCKEAQTFIDHGRADRIIPFVIEGNPFSNDTATECYPEVLLNLTGNNELLAANINEMGRDAAVIKVVARMFGLTFDSLWQRYEREKKRKRWLMFGGVILIAVIASFLASIFFHLNQELETTIGDRDRALVQIRKDSVVLSEHLERIMQDSLTLSEQKDSIRIQKDRISEERDNVKRANYAMQVNLSRILAEKAIELVDEGDSYLARLLARQALPPHRPYTIEAEKALRIADMFQSTIFRGHTKSVSSVCVSPDGKYIFSASADSTIRMWDVNTGKYLKSFKGLWAVAISNNGKYMAALTGDNSFSVWSVSNGQCVYRDQIEEGDVLETLLFSPNNFLVTASGSGLVDFWDIANKKHTKRIKGHDSAIYSVSFSPDGGLLASSSEDATICLWDVDEGICLDTLVGHKEDVLSVKFSNNGKYLVSASKDGCCNVWRILKKKGTLFKTIDKRNEIIRDACFSPNDNYIATASDDKKLRIFSISNWSLIKTLEGHQGAVNSVSFSKNGIISSSNDGTVRLWNSPVIKHNVNIDDIKICSKAFNPKGNSMIVLLNKEFFSVKNIKTNKSQFYRGHNGIVNVAEYSSDGKKIVSASEDQSSIIWNAVSSQIIYRLKHSSSVNSAHFIKNDTEIITSTENGTISIWSTRNGKLLFSKNIAGEAINDAYYYESKDLIVCVTKYRILILDAQTGKLLSRSSEHTGIINSVDFRPDLGVMLTASDDKTLRLWNISGKCLKAFVGHSERVLSSTISPDGHYFVSLAYDKKMYIWDMYTSTLLQSIDIPDYGVACYSTDGGQIVVCSDKGILDVLDFPSLQTLMKKTDERFVTRPLSSEEKKNYYLE